MFKTLDKLNKVKINNEGSDEDDPNNGNLAGVS